MRNGIAKSLLLAFLALSGTTSRLLPISHAQRSGASFSPQIPKVWDDEAVSSWSLPLVGLGQPPVYISADYYYRMPERTIKRTYPIYVPGKEPPGYMDWLKQQEPEIAFDPAKLKTEADWIKAGEVVFNAPFPQLPGTGTATVEDLQSADFYQAAKPPVAADGTLPLLRYAIARKGEVVVAITASSGCHTRVMPDGKVIVGAQGNNPTGAREAYLLRRLDKSQRITPALLFANSTVPWLSPDPAEGLRSISFEDYLTLVEDARQPGVVPRPGTSFLYPAKTSDLAMITSQVASKVTV
jgi:hypothetical protein